MGPALDEITRIVHVAAATKSRHLILVTGVPGAGKTLVGLQTVHAKYLDDLAVERSDGKPTAPAVFLSGNGGSGQEIHVGEEAGLGQWRAAVQGSNKGAEWSVHAPPAVTSVFGCSSVPFEAKQTLALDTGLRFHQARELHQFVDQLLTGDGVSLLAPLGARLNADGMHLRITRSLGTAKEYLRERYADDRDARYGIIASSKDRDLLRFGIPNDFQSTKHMRVGPWYGDDEDDYSGPSCWRPGMRLTEFGAQGHRSGAKVRNPLPLESPSGRVAPGGTSSAGARSNSGSRLPNHRSLKSGN